MENTIKRKRNQNKNVYQHGLTLLQTTIPWRGHQRPLRKPH